MHSCERVKAITMCDTGMLSEGEDTLIEVYTFTYAYGYDLLYWYIYVDAVLRNKCHVNERGINTSSEVFTCGNVSQERCCYRYRHARLDVAGQTHDTAVGYS